MQIGGNNMNNAARTQGVIAQSPNYTNQAAGYSTALNSLFGNAGGSGGGILGGIGSALGSLFSGGNSFAGFNSAVGGGENSLLGGQFSSGNTLNGMGTPSFDFSNIGNSPAGSTDLTGLNMDNMGDYGF
jgi:hypothetical protein